MPRVKQVVAAAQRTQEEEPGSGATEVGSEGTYEVVGKRVALRKGPKLSADVVFLLRKGECVRGRPCQSGGLPWLRLSPESLQEHPEARALEGQDVWALMDGSGTDLGCGQLLARAPTELGWRAADGESLRSDVWEVEASSAPVWKAKGDTLAETDVLLEGSLVKALEIDEEAGRLRFQLVAGDGPEEGWADVKRLARASRRFAAPGQEGARGRGEAKAHDEEKAREAMGKYGERLWKKPEEEAIFSQRMAFDWRTDRSETKAPGLAEEDVMAQLSQAMAKAGMRGGKEERRADSEDCCALCSLPLGDAFYLHKTKNGQGGAHAECLAQILLKDLKDEDLERQSKDRTLKKLRREEYKIGWKFKEHIPLNCFPAERLANRPVPHGLLALALTKDSSVALVPTACPAAAINLEYLSVALKVRMEEGCEPLFSLDPVDPDITKSMQIKRFEPHWLKGTSVGDVLFESDYHLKELSFGVYDQPIVGMKSCFDFSDEEGDNDWCAREWFVVNSAHVEMSEDGVLIPCCKMGVEAREQSLKDGLLEDVKVTRRDHPLVKYGEAFTRYFDLIAERKSVIFHLRELAKASIMAKYLVESDASLGRLWLDLYEHKEAPCILEVPQLWNYRAGSQIRVRDGVILDEGLELADSLRAVYGGVQFGLNSFRMAPSGPSSALQARKAFVPPRFRAPGLQAAKGLGFRPVGRSFVPGRAGFAPGAGLSARPGFFAPGSRGPLRGVDLNLGRFQLTSTTPSSRKEPLAFSESLDDCVPLGASFWRQLEGGEASTLPEAERDVLREIFNPCLSDRRSEGELFIPPDTAFEYGRRLKALLREEKAVCQKRKEHFFSTDFAMGNAGSLFPSSWTSAFEVSLGREAASQRGLLRPRPDFQARAAEIQQALEAAAPVLDRKTEDGLRWRIYRIGSLEVRTTERPEAKEEIGAVFAQTSAGEAERVVGVIDKSEKLDRVTVYVEADPEKPGKGRYFLLVETEKGHIVVSELLQDGSATWGEDPPDVAERCSLAKVLRFADGLSQDADARTVEAFRAFRASWAEVGSGRRYVEKGFSRLVPRRAGLQSFERFAAKMYPQLQELLGLEED